MITTADFSEKTLEVYKEAKKGKISSMTILLETLLECDFPKSELISFTKKHFKDYSDILSEHIKNYIY